MAMSHAEAGRLGGLSHGKGGGRKNKSMSTISGVPLSKSHQPKSKLQLKKEYKKEKVKKVYNRMIDRAKRYSKVALITHMALGSTPSRNKAMRRGNKAADVADRIKQKYPKYFIKRGK